MTKNQSPIFRLTPTTLDRKKFKQLYKILLRGCFDRNYSATARILGISPITAKKWETEPPQGPWHNHILQLAIKECYTFLRNHKKRKYRDRAVYIQYKLSQCSLHELRDTIEVTADNRSGAVRHLLLIMLSQPAHELNTKDLTKHSIKGPYSVKMLRLAAQTLQLVKDVRGFGPDKQSYWCLPTPDDPPWTLADFRD